MAQFYINQFKMRLEAGADDSELNDIIEAVSDIIEDNAEYKRFYEAVTEMYMDSIRG